MLYNILINIYNNWEKHKEWWSSKEIEKHDKEFLVLHYEDQV